MPVQYFTDQNAVFNMREVFETEKINGGTPLTIGQEPATDNFLGFGVAITGSSCYLLNQMTSDERTALLEDLYTEKGLNLSVGRISIASSDYSAELYSYDNEPDDIELKHFSIERDEKYIIPMIKEILKIRPDLYLFASPWSPPAWMKTGGSMCGGYMRDCYVDCFADYVVKFIKAYSEHGIKISAITPQNEPGNQQCNMPSCVWHPETEAKYICSLKKKLAEQNLDVKIWMYDHNFNNTIRVLWSLDNLPKLKDATDGVAFHYYEGIINQTLEVRKKYPSLELHFTEGGPRLFDNYDSDWCKWSLMMTRVLSCGYRSFTGWNLILDQYGRPNIGPFFCGGLVTRHSITGELSYSGQYKAFRHVAPYINKNSKIYAVTSDDGDTVFAYPKTNPNVEGFAVVNDGKTSAIVLVNPASTKRQVTFTVNNTNYYADLNGSTVSTIVF